MEAVEDALESSDEEGIGGLSPPPNKRSRVEGSSLTSHNFSGHFLSVNKHRMQNKMRSNGDSESSGNGDVLLEHQNGATDTVELKEKNREKIAKKKLNKFDEEMVRLIGQHLDKLGMQ